MANINASSFGGFAPVYLPTGSQFDNAVMMGSITSSSNSINIKTENGKRISFDTTAAAGQGTTDSDIIFTTADSTKTSGNAGDINFVTGDGKASSRGGSFQILTGSGGSTSGDGGSFNFVAGDGGGSGAGGDVVFQTGDGGASSGQGGLLGIEAGIGHTPNGVGGSVALYAGDGVGSGNGGDVILQGGGSGAGGDGGGVTITAGTGGTNGTIRIVVGGVTYLWPTDTPSVNDGLAVTDMGPPIQLAWSTIPS
jgi:hypothetical protein